MAFKIVGILFMILGVVWSILDQFMCRGLCKACSPQAISPCFFLFLFVGLIFVMVGYSIVIMQYETQKKA